jgi:tetratricopeptide (TPR) repeat protein
VLTGLVERQPNNVVFLTELGITYCANNKWDAAIEYLEKAVRLDPHSYMAAYHLAHRYRKIRRFDLAETYFKRAEELAPDRADPYVFHAMVYLGRDGDIASARRLLEDAHEHTEPSTILNVTRGWVEACAGRYKDALSKYPSDFLHRSASAWGSHSRLLFQPGLAYQLDGDSTKAVAFYQAALTALDSANTPDPLGERHLMRGISLAGLGRKEEAIADGLAGAELAGDHYWAGPLARESLAQIYVMVGEDKAALGILEQVLSMPSDISPALLRIDPTWIPLRSYPEYQRMIEKSSSTDISAQ